MDGAIERQLLPGEQVVWHGRPSTGLIFRPVEAFLIPFSLLWAGFAVFWNASVWSSPAAGAPIGFKLFGLPFLIAGLYVTVGRFFVDQWLRRQLNYVVTDRRVLIFKNSGTTSKSLELKRLPALDLSERADGSGTIRFGPATSWFGGGNFGIWQPTFDATPQFLRIDNVRAVYQQIAALAG